MVVCFIVCCQIDDQIALLINAWCELLVFSCCYRSVNSPGIIRVSNLKTLTLETARQHGIEKCVDKMLHFTDSLRRLQVDYYEYVSMKVIVLLTSGKTTSVQCTSTLTFFLALRCDVLPPFGNN